MGKFVVKKTETGIKFSLLAGNGEVIADSQVYKAKTTCLKGIESVKKNVEAPIFDTTEEGAKAVANPKFEVYKDKAGEFRFRLKAKNGQIIAVGEGYKEKKSCLKGIASVKKNAPAAKITE